MKCELNDNDNELQVTINVIRALNSLSNGIWITYEVQSTWLERLWLNIGSRDRQVVMLYQFNMTWAGRRK